MRSSSAFKLAAVHCEGTVAVNSARGRKWPTNLERDPRITVLVYEAGNPYNDVEMRPRGRDYRGRR